MGRHTLEACESVYVYALGDSRHGQCGVISATPITKPTWIPEISGKKLRAISAGYRTTVAAFESRANDTQQQQQQGHHEEVEVVAFGCNDSGQLMTGSYSMTSLPNTCIETSFTNSIHRIACARTATYFLTRT
jgi:alpha-tubulin suppressor-like RCC1 family protein